MKLIYCATPKRIFHKSNEIINKVLSTGNAPFFPFFSFPINIFEDGPIGREKTINFCLKSIEICDELWFFGLSEGTILELNHAKNIGKKNKIHRFI